MNHVFVVALIAAWVIAELPSLAGHKALPGCISPVSPTWKKLDDSAWANSCRTRIDNSLEQHKSFGPLPGLIMCTFLLEPDGRISDLFIYSSRQSKETNRMAMEIVSDSAPFAKPPEELLHKQRLAVSFQQGIGSFHQGRFRDFEVMMNSKEFKGAGDRDAMFEFWEHDNDCW
jgi:hypothetical protein